MPVVLTIAGSDPGGGAGIQSDLRTFHAMGVHGLSAITALTEQNSQGVQNVHPVAPNILAGQLQSLFDDVIPDAVKIGMLGAADQVQVVAEMLRRYQPPNIVLDPVLASSGGASLLDGSGQAVLTKNLLPLCNLVTPNLMEASLLTGLDVRDISSMRTAAAAFRSRGAHAVLVKGGHLTGAPVDVFVDSGGEIIFYAERVETPHTHGTGCLLSSAIAAFLAHGHPLRESIAQVKQVMTAALSNPAIIGHGRGYPVVHALSVVANTRNNEGHCQRLEKLHGLYVVTDSRIKDGRGPTEIAEAALAGGARIIQLREKNLSTPVLIDFARHLRTMTLASDALLIINDRVDVALASDADGVHLGPDDMSPKDARRLLGWDKLIGVSTGRLADAIDAAPFASYFGVGAIYGSQTKLDAGAPVGVSRVREIKAAFPNIPVVAIGGINQGNIAEVAAAGADSAAAVSAVVAAPDVAAAAQDLSRLFMHGRPPD